MLVEPPSAEGGTQGASPGRQGTKEPVFHWPVEGLTTYGCISSVLLQHEGHKWAELLEREGNTSRGVFPGERLTILSWSYFYFIIM